MVDKGEPVLLRQQQQMFIIRPEHFPFIDRLAIPVELRYEDNDPLALNMRFKHKFGYNDWYAARSLFDEVTSDKINIIGDGDILLKRRKDENGDNLVIFLQSSTGKAHLEVPTTDIVSFIEKTKKLVPIDEESDIVKEDLENYLNTTFS